MAKLAGQEVKVLVVIGLVMQVGRMGHYIKLRGRIGRKAWVCMGLGWLVGRGLLDKRDNWALGPIKITTNKMIRDDIWTNKI